MHFESIYFCCGCSLCANVSDLCWFIKTMMISGVPECSDVFFFPNLHQINKLWTEPIAFASWCLGRLCSCRLIRNGADTAFLLLFSKPQRFGKWNTIKIRMNINFKSPDHNNAKNLEPLKGEYTFTHTRHEVIRQGRSAAAEVGQQVVVVVFVVFVVAPLCPC